VERCIMANSGIVKLLIGEVKAVAVDGTERLLHVGEKVLLNEQIITGDAGSIAIDFTDGTRMDLGRGSSTMLTTDLLGTTAATVQSVSSAEGEVEAIQQALAADQTFDPSKLAAPAAGGVQETQSLEDDGQSIVEVDYLNPAMTPVNGFETTDIDNADTLVLDLTRVDLILEPRSVLLAAAEPETPETPETPDEPEVPVTPEIQVTDHKIDLAVADNEIAENATSTVTGTLNLTAPEGLAFITVGGNTILEADLLNSGTASIAMSTDLGTLTIDGFDPATGTVSYSYLQKGLHKDHSISDDGNPDNGVEFDDSIIDKISITVTDDISVTSTPDVLDILITDSVPEAKDNSEFIGRDKYDFLADNVIFNVQNAGDTAENDDFGADGATLKSVTYEGQSGVQTKDFSNSGDIEVFAGNDFIVFETDENGSLYIRDDGQYWFEELISKDELQAKGGEVQDSFGYQLIDGDGDLSSATLTITQVLGDINTGLVGGTV